MLREQRLLAARTRRYRARRGLTVSELSRLSGVSPRTIKRIEASDIEGPDFGYDPKLSTISNLANSFDISLSELTQPV